MANGGTLYLEQIEYLPAEMQSALLQVLKTGVVIRLNSSRVIPVDVRVIAGSAADLPLLVQQNRFRRQLFYSLQAFEIQIPPLRQRQAIFRCWSNTICARWSSIFSVAFGWMTK